MKLLQKIQVLENHLASTKVKLDISKILCWNDYFDLRGISSCVDIENEEKSLFSKLLSFPLTASNALKTVTFKASSIEVLVLGARSEATLPLLFWNEINSFIDVDCKINILFAGPDVSIRSKHVQGDMSFEYDKTKLAKLVNESTQNKFDLICLFNSGIGSYFEGNNWNHDGLFLKNLRSLSKHCLFTSFNESDFLQDKSSIINPYIETFELPNRFRSLWEEKTMEDAPVYNNYASFVAKLK